MYKRLLIPLLTLLAATAYAQNASDGETAQLRRYTVEMIVFSYAQEVATGTEIYVAEMPVEADFADPRDSEPEPVERRIYPDLDFVRLAREDFTLTDIAERIQRLDVYRPLMHFGWTQTTLPKEDTAARPLAAYARPPRGLDGDLTLTLNRYLHLAVDLQLDAPTTQDQMLRYRIDENRILRSGELRYFDHPKFGVVAKVTRAEDPADNGELLGDIGQ